MVRRSRFWGALFGLHLLLIFGVSFSEANWLVASGATVLSPVFSRLAHRLQVIAATNVAGPTNVGLKTYLHAAGLESGYGFFAPNVPPNYRLIFAFFFVDGREVQADPDDWPNETKLRFASLMDYLGRTRSALVREDLIKLLAHDAWQKYPDAVRIRASLQTLDQPKASEFREGKKPAYIDLYDYDFTPAIPQS